MAISRELQEAIKVIERFEPKWEFTRADSDVDKDPSIMFHKKTDDGIYEGEIQFHDLLWGDGKANVNISVDVTISTGQGSKRVSLFQRNYYEESPEFKYLKAYLERTPAYQAALLRDRAETEREQKLKDKFWRKR